MPTRKKRPAKKATKQASRTKAPAKKAPAQKAAAKKSPAKKAPAKKAPARKASSAPSQTPTPNLGGRVIHTELASADPSATKLWCATVLGWTFQAPSPMPGGEEYHLFVYSDTGGGGIRRHNPPEVPGSIPYIQVDDVDAAFARAISAGAEEMLPPTPVMEGVTIAIVRAPGSVPIGLSESTIVP